MVTVACDAEQALLQLQRRPFTFLISDVRMPGMSGTDLALQARRLCPSLRVILTSALSNLSLREGAVEAFLQKPIEPESLNKLLTTDRRRPFADATPASVQRSARLSDKLRSATA
jgi:DNA-binding NtrC family response regulator